MQELIRSSHSVGEANYHMQFTPAYRQDIFKDELIKILTRDYIVMAGQKHGIPIAAIGFGPDHCHIFVVSCKNYGPAQIAKILKGFSSYMMRKNHKKFFIDMLGFARHMENLCFSNELWGEKFWSSGYFYRTVGAVNSDTIKHYVEESQGKHFGPKEEHYVENVQKNLINFGS